MAIESNLVAVVVVVATGDGDLRGIVGAGVLVSGDEGFGKVEGGGGTGVGEEEDVLACEGLVLSSVFFLVIGESPQGGGGYIHFMQPPQPMKCRKSPREFLRESDPLRERRSLLLLEPECGM